MQKALNITERWRAEENLKVNPLKTALITFTRKRNLGTLTTPTFFQERLNISGKFKYLGVTLDARLTWNEHLNSAINKGKMALMAAKRAVGKTWGLKPRMVLWLYTAVVRPKIAYGFLVWWPKIEQKQI